MSTVQIEHFGGAESATLNELCSKFGKALRVKERSKATGLSRYYVSIERAEVMEHGMLYSVHGNGNTVDEALADLARSIEGRRVAVDANYTDRREYDIPNKVIV